MRVEIAGESRAQAEGRNEDVWTQGQLPVPWAAVIDGAGNAQGCAKRASTLLETWISDLSLARLLRDEDWIRLARRLDSAMQGGSQATMALCAVLGDQAVVVTVGDGRAALVRLEGHTDLLTLNTRCHLGSGEASPQVARVQLAPEDVIVLASDAGWNPLGESGVDAAVRKALPGHFESLPGALLDSAPGALTDDATVVTQRILHG